MLKAKGILRPMILAMLLGMGFALVWCVLALWIIAATLRRDDEDFQRLCFHVDGTPVIQTAGGLQDLAGNTIEQNSAKKLLHTIYFDARAQPPVYSLPATWDQRMRAFADAARPSAFWYFITDGDPHGSAYLVGYDIETNKRLGFIGKAGFREDEPPMQARFPFDGTGGLHPLSEGIRRHVISPQNPGGMQTGRPGLRPLYADASLPGLFEFGSVYVHAADDKLYRIDLSRRLVSVILENKRIGSMQWMFEGDSSKSTGLAIRTTEEILVINNDMEVAKKFQLPPELRGENIDWGVASDGTALAWITKVEVHEGKLQNEVYWLDTAGHAKRHESITLRTSTENLRFWVSAIVPSPAFLTASLALIWPVFMLFDGKIHTLPEALAQIPEDYWLSLLFVFLVGGVLAGFCYRREVRYGASRTERMLWPIFVFVFGLHGWIGYRFARLWPDLVRCPVCQAKVPCNRINCAACQTEFPRPGLKGTEVFA